MTQLAYPIRPDNCSAGLPHHTQWGIGKLRCDHHCCLLNYGWTMNYAKITRFRKQNNIIQTSYRQRIMKYDFVSQVWKYICSACAHVGLSNGLAVDNQLMFCSHAENDISYMHNHPIFVQQLVNYGWLTSLLSWYSSRWVFSCRAMYFVWFGADNPSFSIVWRQCPV